MSASDSLSEASQPLEQEGEEGWDDWESDEGTGFQSLFEEARFQSLEEVLQHDQQQHSFSLRQYRAQVGWVGRRVDRSCRMCAAAHLGCPCSAGLVPRPFCCSSPATHPCIPNSPQCALQHGLDQLGTIRLVNFIRVQAAAGLDPRPALAGLAPGSGAAPWLDDRYLQARQEGEVVEQSWMRHLT